MVLMFSGSVERDQWHEMGKGVLGRLHESFI